MKINFFYMLLIFNFFFCALSSGGPVHFLRNLGRKHDHVKQKDVLPERSLSDAHNVLDRKFVEFDKSWFETNERAGFYFLIDKYCKTEELMDDIKQFYLEENEFVKDLEYKTQIMNTAIRLLRNAEGLQGLNSLTEVFNKELECFFREKQDRYSELISDIYNYTQSGDGLLHRLILTKYELLREKQKSIILIWNNFCELFYFSVGLLLCARKRKRIIF